MYNSPPQQKQSDDILPLWVAVAECCLCFCYTTTTKHNRALSQSVSHSVALPFSSSSSPAADVDCDDDDDDDGRFSFFFFSTKFRSFALLRAEPNAAPENLFENFCGFYARRPPPSSSRAGFIVNPLSLSLSPSLPLPPLFCCDAGCCRCCCCADNCLPPPFPRFPSLSLPPPPPHSHPNNLHRPGPLRQTDKQTDKTGKTGD